MTRSDKEDVELSAGYNGKEKEGRVENETETEDLPIDRGWAWIVLAGCFMNAAIMVGYNRSQSLFFVEYLEVFEASTTTTTLILAVKALSFSLMAVVTMHVLLHFLGIRKTVLLGGVFSAVAVLAAALAPNIVFLICVHGILGGIGQTMIHSPALVLVGQYFRKRRGLATTTAGSAISFSQAVFPIMSQHLLTEYGLRGTLLIFVGITLNILVGASLYRPLDFYRKKPKPKPSQNQKDYLAQAGEESRPMIAVGDVKVDRLQVTDKCDSFLLVASSIELSRSVGNSHTSSLLLEHEDMATRRRTFSEGSRRVYDNVSNAEKLIYASNPDFLSVSLVDLHEKDGDKSSSDGPHVQNATGISCAVKRTVRKVLKAFDFSLFRKPMFILIAAFSHFGIVIRHVGTFLPARANELGFTQSDAALLLLIMGSLDFICRILYGLLADLKMLKVHQIMAAGLVLAGVTCLCTPFFTTFTLLIVYSVILGIFGSAYQCLLPVVIIDFMGIDFMAKTLGFVSLFQGFSSALTYPIIGVIKDSSGSYAQGYQYIGSTALIAAAMLMFEPLVRRYDEKRIDNLEVRKTAVSEQ